MLQRVVAAVARRLQAELLPVLGDDAAERALRRILRVGGAEHGAAEVLPPGRPTIGWHRRLWALGRRQSAAAGSRHTGGEARAPPPRGPGGSPSKRARLWSAGRPHGLPRARSFERAAARELRRVELDDVVVDARARRRELAAHRHEEGVERVVPAACAARCV